MFYMKCHILKSVSNLAKFISCRNEDLSDPEYIPL
jgi:hypothetical protein